LFAVLSMLIAPVVGAVTEPTVPAAAEPAPSTSDSGVGSGLDQVIRAMIDNLGDNVYQTGFALIAATMAVIAMRNTHVHKAVLVPVAVGAFWAGWLGWNTVTGQRNPLFPGDVDATKLWDVAFTSDTGFLIVVIVACVAAVFLWHSGTTMLSRVVLLAGAVLGASFVYNLFEAVRYS
jgi:hypothetical protein